MCSSWAKGCLPLISSLAFLAGGLPAQVLIDNDVPSGTFGHFRIEVAKGGESRTAFITGLRADTNTLVTTEVIYDYFTYIDVGAPGSGFRIHGDNYGILTGGVLSGDDEVSSSGTFQGEAGNTIGWTAVSSIPDGGDVMTTVYEFTAQTGALGQFRLLQYLDEDVIGVSDDFFYTRGSLAAETLELYTIDNTRAIGISHGGAYSVSQGLNNASFAGWAASIYNQIKPDITSGGQPVSLTGIIESFLAAYASTNQYVGAGYGPRDIVSVMAWDVDPNATTARIVTTLGGVPDATNLPPDAVCQAYPTDTGTPVGSNITVSCNIPGGGRMITLDASASTDPDNDPLDFTWSVSNSLVSLADPNAAVTTGIFPLGITTATVTVTDGRGGMDVCDVLVTVIDTSPPNVLCTTDVATLWPPKHNMVPVQVLVVATDPCSSIASVVVTVASDEPDDQVGNGDGFTTGDVNGGDGYTAAVPVTMAVDANGNYIATVMLRAERLGAGDGRTYTINAVATDAYSNAQTSSCCVVVPHAKRYGNH